MTVAQIKREAAERGDSQYFTGKPCRRGHVAARFTVNSTCVECDREKYHAKSEQRIVQMAEWRAANPDKVKAACANWRANNPGAVRTHRNLRKARVTKQGPGFTHQQVLSLVSAQGGKCGNCLKKVGGNFHADHIVPLAKGGAHDIRNIQILCPSCNQRKHKKDPIDWARQNGRLL